jgi:RNA polymerase sigma factor for flagellar operon FliA
MDAESLFRANLRLIERVVSEVCRRARMRDADVEDFISTVKLALLENDFQILRRWEGRSSLAAYLSVVIRRLLCDQRVREMGRWRPSSEARRMGTAAVLLEQMLHRDGWALEDAVSLVCTVEPSLSRAGIVAMAARLPVHERRRRPLELVEVAEPAAADRADSGALAYDAQRIARRAGLAVRETMAQWADEDAVILRLRYGASMSIADISRMLRLPQRPLYRRIESMLTALRQALTNADLDAATLAEVIGSAVQDLDFGLDSGKNGSPGPSSNEETKKNARVSQ